VSLSDRDPHGRPLCACWASDRSWPLRDRRVQREPLDRRHRVWSTAARRAL